MDRLDKIKEGIRDENHQTVWFEMKRNQAFLDELNILFQSAPEALEW